MHVLTGTMFGELKSALLVQFRHHRTMTRFYRSDSFCKQNLLLKSRQRRFVDKMAHRLVKVAEKHTHRKRKVTFAVGNCIDHPCSRGHCGGRLPNSKLVKALARIRRVVLIDEYNTTKRYVQKHSLILLTRIYQTQQLPQPGVFSVNPLRCISTGICHVESTSLLDTDEASRCSILLEHDWWDAEAVHNSNEGECSWKQNILEAAENIENLAKFDPHMQRWILTHFALHFIDRHIDKCELIESERL